MTFVVTALFFSWSGFYGDWTFRQKHLVTNKDFEIRILERYTFLANYTYRFQVSRPGTGTWRNVLEFTADPMEITDRAQVVSSTVGYVYTNRDIAITRDAGETWIISTLDDIVPMTPEISGRTWIDSVEINAAGAGQLKLRSRSRQTLITNDYGSTWH